MRYPVKITLFLLLLLPCLQALSQSAGFTATIGVNTFTVKNGDVLHVCKGGTIQYKSTATNYINLAWRYTNGSDPVNNSFTAFSVNYAQTGNEFYTVQKLSFFGKPDDSIKVKVIVTEKEASLKAGFSITPATTECGNTNFSFDAVESSGTGLTYYWQFGDGAQANGRIATHAFLSAIGASGTRDFTIKLIVTNKDGCSDEITKTITVTKIPDATLGTSNAELTNFNGLPTFRKCEKLDSYSFIFFNNSSTAETNTRYRIIWGDGSPDYDVPVWNISDPVTHTYTLGNTVLTFEVTNSVTGCVSVKKYNVFIGSNSEGSISLSTSTGNTTCIGSELEFTLSNYQNNPPGTLYYIFLNDGHPFPNPLDSFIHPPPQTYKHTFTSSSCGKSYETFNNSFYIKLIAENACNLFPAGNSAYPIYISDTPRAAIYTDTVACINYPLRITDLSSYGSIINSSDNQLNCVSNGKRLWKITPSTGYTLMQPDALGSFNGNFFDWDNWQSGLGSFDVKFTTPGTYKIKIYISNNNNCKKIDSTEISVCVRDVPLADIQLNSGDSCNTATIKFKPASQITCAGNTYKWSVFSSDPNNCSANTDYSFTGGTNALMDSAIIKFTGAGKYNVVLNAQAKNASTCPVTSDTSVINIKAPPLVNISNINSICAGNTISPNASVVDCYSGDSLLYKWTFSNGIPSASPLVMPASIRFDGAGIQKVLLDVTNSCGTTKDSVSFEVTDKPKAEAGPVREICSGKPVSIGTNTGNFVYHWSPSTGLNNPNIAQPTLTLVNNNDKNDTLKYFVTVSGGINCEATDSVLVIVKKSPLVATNIPAATVCEGSSIQLTASGADSYIWLPATFLNTSSGNSVISTPSGSVVYTVTGSFANGCSDNATINIVFAKTPVAEAGLPKEICSGSSATIGTNTGAYNYLWSPANGLNNPGIAQPTVTLTNNNIINDTLTYYLTASLGICSSRDSVQIIVKRSPIVTTNIATATICEGNNVEMIATGADTYTWSPATYLNSSTGSTVICTPLSSIVYSVTGSFNNGCSNSTPINIQFAKTPVADAGALKEVCSGSSVTIGINTGPYNYLWSPGIGLNNPNIAQPVVTLTNTNIINDTVIYYLTTTLGTCISKDSVQVVIKRSPDINITPANPQICIGNSTPLNAKGADNYQWSPQDFLSSIHTPSVIASPVSDITYSVYGSLQNGCTQTKSVTVKVNPDALATFTPINYSGCAPYNLDTIITANNYPFINAKYYWYINNSLYDSSNTAVPVSYNLPNAGDSVIVQLITTSLYGCKPDTLGPVIFKTGDGIKALYTQSTISGCEPLSVQFTNASSILNNSVAFNWNFGNGQTSTNIQPGTILFNSGPESQDTTYFVKLIAKNTCATDSLKTSVHVLPKPIARFASNDSTTGCSPYTMTFKNTSKGNPLNYQWDFGDGTFFSTTKDTSVTHIYNSSVLDTFIVKLIAFNNCGTDTLLLPVVIAPNTISAQVSTFGNNIYGCVPHTVNFINNTTGALNGIWNYGDGTGETLPGSIINVSHTYRDTGTFTVTVNFDNGCSKASYSEQIFVYSRPQASFILLDTTNHYICFKDSTHINITQQTGNLNRLYWGDNNLYFSPPVTSHYYNSTGIYNITLIADRNNSFGTVCSDTATEVVHIVTRPDTKATSSNEVTCFKPYSQLTATGGRLYQWHPGYGLDKTDIYNPVARPVENTLYYVKVTGESGCVVKDSVMVLVDFTKASSKDFIPSGFTPNGDGLNDCIHVLKAGIYGQNIDKLDFNIYNRLGELIFHTNNTSDCWNGFYKGRPQPPGTYVYTLRLQSICTEGKDLFFKGTIVLIK